MTSLPPLQDATPFVRWRIRWTWRWWRWTGWEIEGPFPQWRDRSILILGPGLHADSPALDFIRMRMGFRAQWLDPLAPPPSSGCLLHPHSPEPQSLQTALGFAQQHDLPFHLVQFDPRHRRIRCNTPVQVGPFPDRVTAYVQRIFSYSAG